MQKLEGSPRYFDCKRNAASLKKILILLLIAGLLVPMFTIVSNAAVNKTREEAIAWIYASEGKAYDMDGVPYDQPYQCVDYIKAYYQYLIGNCDGIWGDGKDYATNYVPDGFTRIQGAQPQAGDILVYGATSGNQWGHVGIYISDYVHYDQNMYFNGQNHYYVCKCEWHYNYNGNYWGVIRPNFGGKRTPENLGDDFYAYIIKNDSWKHLELTTGNRQEQQGEDCFNVQLSESNRTDPKQVWHFIRNSDGSYKIYNCYNDGLLDVYMAYTGNGSNVQVCPTDYAVDNQRWFSYPAGGGLHYLVPVHCDKVLDVNNNDNIGGTNVHIWEQNGSTAQIFAIYKPETDGPSHAYVKPDRPDAPTITAVDKAENKTRLSWTESPGKSGYAKDVRVYNLKVWEGTSASGTPKLSEDGITATYSDLTLADGTYTAKVTAVNSMYSDWSSTGTAYTFTVSTKPTITVQPTNVAVEAGKTASTTVTAEGEGLTYQWYLKDPASSKFSASSIKTATYNVTMTEAKNGRQVYCVVTNKYGNSVTSDTVTLKVKTPLAITSQPKNVSVAEGKTASTTITATGDELTYKWYAADPGDTKYYLSSIKTATYKAVMTSEKDGRRVYCVVTDAYGKSLMSDTATLRIGTAPVITAQPKNTSVKINEKASFKVTATGATSYQWQKSDDNGKTWDSFTSTATATTANLAFKATTANARYLYRCKITNAAGTVYSSKVYITLTDAAPIIRTQPKNVKVATNEKASFTVVAPGATSYQWQKSDDNGKTWEAFTATATATTANLKFNASSANARYLYRCAVKNAKGTVYSDAAYIILTDAAPIIRTQPVNVKIKTNDKASFIVVASGATSYQWQRSDDYGKTWEAFTATATATTANLKFNASAANARYLYRCKITNAVGTVYSSRVYITLTDAAPIIRTQPKNVKVAADEKASFTVTAPGATSYQWQKSTDNGKTWTDFTAAASATTANLKIKVTAATVKYKYRCAVTNANGTTYSNAVKITLTA